MLIWYKCPQCTPMHTHTHNGMDEKTNQRNNAMIVYSSAIWLFAPTPNPFTFFIILLHSLLSTCLSLFCVFLIYSFYFYFIIFTRPSTRISTYLHLNLPPTSLAFIMSHFTICLLLPTLIYMYIFVFYLYITSIVHRILNQFIWVLGQCTVYKTRIWNFWIIYT